MSLPSYPREVRYYHIRDFDAVVTAVIEFRPDSDPELFTVNDLTPECLAPCFRFHVEQMIRYTDWKQELRDEAAIERAESFGLRP